MTACPFNIVILGGLTPYADALKLQRRTAKRRQAGQGRDTLFILQHPPVITLGKRAEEGDVIAAPSVLKQMNIEVHRVERGGQATYHGPGQIVAYPIFDLNRLKIGVRRYVEALEAVIVRALATFGVLARKRDKMIGVWTERGKIGAVGVRVEKGVSFHGIALNADPDLAHFKLIVPCGMRDAAVTSIAAEIGRSPSRGEVEQVVLDAFLDVFWRK